MKTRTIVAFAAGIALGFVAASTSGFRVGGPSAADERKRCADLLAHQAEHLRRTGDEKLAKNKRTMIEQTGRDPFPADYHPHKEVIEVLENLREGIDSGAKAP